MIKIVLNYFKTGQVWWLLPISFLLWSAGGVGFLGPIVEKIKKEKQFSNWTQTATKGVKRSLQYIWEILFSALGLTFLTLIWSILNTWVEKQLPEILSIIVYQVSFLVLLFYFFGKMKYIAEHEHLTSLKESFKLTFLGFTSPIKEVNLPSGESPENDDKE